MRKLIVLALLGFIFLLPAQTIVFGQDTAPQGPIYIVQPGDNLTLIASRFGLSADELIAANGIVDANSLKIGDELIIPGLEGIQGYLITETVGFGNSLKQLGIQNLVPMQTLIKLNHITSPAELYAGVNLVVPQADEGKRLENRYLLQSNQSLLEFAMLGGTSPWLLAHQNELSGAWDTLPGESYYLPVGTPEGSIKLSSSPLENVTISPLPLVQGKTAVIQVETSQPFELSGNLLGNELHFFPQSDRTYASLQGIHALQEPGIYPLLITVKLADGTESHSEQMVIVQDGYYAKDPVLTVNESFVDPAITEPELEWLLQITNQFTPEKQWQDIWMSPSPYSYQECLNSKFGNRRSYNGGPFTNIHTGVDFCGGDGVKIYAPADGTVVFAGEKTVRGNATIIDHGWGVFSGYWHQNQIFVKEGDQVKKGDVIGLVGGTGRVTGAHLHFEIWAGGVQVQPLDWLQNLYPPEE